MTKVTRSVVIPVYNGEKTVPELVCRLISVLGPERLEIILVDDGSTDKSDEVCRSQVNKYPQNVLYINLAKNFTEHNAVMAGLNYSKGEYVVIMDDDLQNPPEETPKLFNEAMTKDLDIVYSYYRSKKHGLLSNLGSGFNNVVATFMLRKPYDLYLSSFKCLNRFTVDEIIKYKGPFPYIDGLALRVTRNIGKVLVEHARREEGRSGYTLKKYILLWINMLLNFSILPLRLGSLLGLFLSIAGFLVGVYVVIEKLLDPSLPVGWSFMIVSLVLFSGVQLLMLGLLGEYLGQLFLGSNQTPQFVVRKVCGKGCDGR